MILILTNDKYEQGTEPVIDWLLYYGADFMRLTPNDLLLHGRSILLDIGHNKIQINDRDLLQTTNVVFYRRFTAQPETEGLTDKNQRQLMAETSNEGQDVFRYLFYALRGKKWVPGFNCAELFSNKPIACSLAQDCGLAIPATWIANDKAVFKQMPADALITKPMDYCGYFNRGDMVYTAYTTPLTQAISTTLPDHFFPALFQQKVARAYEVRVFYLDGACYATAVMNPGCNHHHADIKLLYGSGGTHFIPYQLPGRIKTKIRKLMRIAGLSTASIDFIRDVDGQYYFIDLNPVGQYLAPSEKCNYYLEEQLAKYLIKADAA
jgi:glutathione synthase/RimK-type ligase-like ATP-grasp enzyme